MKKEILQRDNPLLKRPSEEVSLEEIKSPKIQEIIAEMKNALKSKEDGVAIAAPQIGYNLRIFIVSKKAFEEEAAKDMVVINPEIINQSKESSLMEEGCLSCEGLYGKVDRKNKTKIKGYNQNAEAFEYGGSGLISQIFQHEIDHLNGILFIDKAEGVVELKKDGE